MKRYLLMALAVSLVLISISACGGNKAPDSAPAPAAVDPNKALTPTPQLSKSGSSGPAPTAALARAATIVPAATSAPAAETAEADETFTLESRDTGLEQLQSYRMTWLAEWSGTEDGKATSGSWNWTEEFNSDPRSLHWAWEFTDSKNTTGSGRMEWWKVANTTYLLGDDGKCIPISSSDDQQATKGIFNPSTLGRVSDARFVGLEINGVPAKHYKYDEKSAIMVGMGQVSGEMWVAVDGEFVVKDVVKWEGGAGVFGMGSNSSDGQGSWTWELMDVNQPIAITPPADCSGAAADLPIMPDATDKSTFGDLITYGTPSKPADVVAFYQREMAAAGWEPEGEPTITEEMSMLSFTKENQQAQVIVTVENEKTQVMINVTG